MLHTNISEVQLEVDGKQMSLPDFLENYIIIEPQLTLEDLVTVLQMKIGESRAVVLGMITIKRLK